MKKVLVVDNHPMVRRMLASRLEKLGHEVRTAEDGLAALEELESFEPDIMLIDLIMPNIDGEQLCRLIRSRPRLAGVFLIIISSIAAEERFDPDSCGADACIAKSGFDMIAANLDLVLADIETHGRILKEHQILGTKEVFRREITQELLSLRRHHNLVLDNIDDGIVELSQTGKITYANPKAVEIFDCRAEEFIGSVFFTHLDPEAAETFQEIINSPAARSLNLASPLYLMSRQVQIALHPLIEEGRRSFIVMLHDITEAKAVENTLRRTTNDLRQSLADLKGTQTIMVRQEKLASIGTLASGVAHEILNPLNIIGTIIQLLQMEEKLSTEVREQLAEVMGQVRRATKITNSLRMFSHRGRGEISLVNIHDLLDNTISLVEHDLQLDNIVVERDYAPDLPEISADPDQLAQVFLNLVGNARDAMKESKERRLLLRTGLIEHGISLMVRDSGSGIAAADLAKIFDPFYTTKDPGSGTGLGLSIVYGIIENLGGFIEVESQPGEGTTFFIILPLTQNRIPEQPEGEAQ